jgi:glycosyltransferase involved in cell wall biosynthesis
MRVAVVVSTFPPYHGGMGNVAFAHADALRHAGHEVTVFAPGIGLRPLLRIGNAAVVPQLLWKLRGFDAVELHYPFFGGAEWVALWKKLYGRHARLSVLYHMDAVGRGVIGFIFRLYRTLLLRWIFSTADAIMVTSRDYFASSQIAFLKEDPRIIEVPLGIDTEYFHPGQLKRNVVLFVGALDSAHYFKGVTVLLEAFATFASDLPDADLEIIGDGNLRASYEMKAKELGLSNRVHFLGRVTDDSLAKLTREAALHVFPSTDRSEAFGLVTLAAAASGIPSIVSDLPGVRTLIEPGVTGLIVPPNDPQALASAMRSLLSDPSRAQLMGAAARNRAVNLYATTVIDRTVIKTICG